jgi:ubiquinone/menaquinone biosynthesis C-methylase UbiE
MGKMDADHKTALVEYFSSIKNYWENMYNEDGGNKLFRSVEVLQRRQSVLGFLDEFSQGKKLSVLDVGCGVGSILELVLERGHAAYGLDITVDMVKRACEVSEKYCSDGSLLLAGDVHDLPFSDKSFDVVLCIGVLQFLPGDRAVLQEINRVVKTGGIAIVSVPNLIRINNILDPYYLFYMAPRFVKHKLKRLRKKGMKSPDTIDFKKNTDFSNRRYYFGQLHPEFLNCDFVNYETCAIGFGPFTFFGKQIFPLKWSQKINDFFNRISRIRWFGFLIFFANRWVYCLKKAAA